MSVVCIEPPQRRAPAAGPRRSVGGPRLGETSNAVLGAAILCVAAPVLVAIAPPGVIRLPAVLGFFCISPGVALVALARGRAEPGLIVGASLGVVALVALLMLWLGAWRPQYVLYGLSGACLLALSPNLRALRRRRVAGGRQLQAPRRLGAAWVRAPRAMAVHATLVSGALTAWGLSLAGSNLARMGGLGLLQALAPAYFVAFGLLILGFALAAANEALDPKIMGAYVLALIVVLHATTALLYDEPRYAWTYKHLGVINLIAHTGRVNRQIDIYNNWPAFFAANAWLSKTAGLAPILYAGWAQLFFNIVNAITVRFALRGLTADQRVLWTATFFFVLGNWVAQDYLAPQAFGFALSLMILGLCLRCSPAAAARRPRRDGRLAARPRRLVSALLASRAEDDVLLPPPLAPRAALLVGAICFLAVVASHQLSPLLLIVDVAALAVLARRLPLWLPVVMTAVEVCWLIPAWSFLTSHFTLIDPGGAGSTAPAGNVFAALPGATLSLYAPAAVMITVAILAMLGGARRARGGKRDVVPACLIVAPALAVLLQSYGGEGPYRAFLFALPWLAYFAAFACVRSPLTARRARIRYPHLIVSATIVAPCLLLAYFGQDLTNHIPSDDVRVASWYELHAPAGSLRVNLAPTAPDRLTWRYPLVSLADPPSLVEQPQFTGHLLGPADVPRLEAYIRKQGHHQAYVVLTLGQENYGRLHGLLPSASAIRLVQALERTPAFQLVYRRPTAWLFQYTTDRASRQIGHPPRRVAG